MPFCVLRKTFPFFFFLCLCPFRNNGVLSVFWYVTGKRDIADFYVVIRHISTGEIIYETTVGYHKRNVDVRQAALNKESWSNMQLCIIAKRSSHELGLFLESQCVRLSDALKGSESNRNFYSTVASGGGSVMRLLEAPLMHFFCLLFWAARLL